MRLTLDRYDEWMIEVVTGDLTQQPVDAIVNAANEHLAHGGGVAAAIVRAGGSTIQAESDRWVAEHGPLQPGHAAITSAGVLTAEKVIHVVGPRFRNGQDNSGLLRQAVEAGLNAAKSQHCRSIAMPAISAGIFGYPRPEACQVIAQTVQDWIDANPDSLDRVLLVGYDGEAATDFRVALSRARETEAQ